MLFLVTCTCTFEKEKTIQPKLCQCYYPFVDIHVLPVCQLASHEGGFCMANFLNALPDFNIVIYNNVIDRCMARNRELYAKNEICTLQVLKSSSLALYQVILGIRSGSVMKVHLFKGIQKWVCIRQMKTSSISLLQWKSVHVNQVPEDKVTFMT